MLERLRESFRASVGDIVFGMEDGTVSIFGLVFGVAATTTDKATVLIAGASGAVAAAVSTMAGTYLDVETRQDEAKAKSLLVIQEVEHDQAGAVDRVIVQLIAAGLAPDQTQSMSALLRSDPTSLRAVASALADGVTPATSQSPFVHSLWMLAADFLAAAIPIVPFALLPVPQGRVVSAIVTMLLLVVLGVGRAIVGSRSVVRTVIETVSIGVAAALAGVAIGAAISRWFGG
jgi:vacuolar iron transporter family protein